MKLEKTLKYSIYWNSNEEFPLDTISVGIGIVESQEGNCGVMGQKYLALVAAAMQFSGSSYTAIHFKV